MKDSQRLQIGGLACSVEERSDLGMKVRKRAGQDDFMTDLKFFVFGVWDFTQCTANRFRSEVEREAMGRKGLVVVLRRGARRS